MLLRTKINIPKLAFKPLERSYLEQNRVHLEMKKLTLIVAPAGYGKTTTSILLCRKSQRKIAWFSIDSDDNTVDQFFLYLIAAFQKTDPSIGQELVSFIKDSSSFIVQNLAVELINDIELSGVPLLLVLEDFHFINNNEIKKLIDFLLEHLPENLHIIINSRHQTDLSVIRLKVSEQMIEIDKQQLRYSEAELRRYLKSHLKKVPDDTLTKQVMEKTEGWAAAVQLTVQALNSPVQTMRVDNMEQHSSIENFITFLLDDVLNTVELSLREFIIHTSQLTRFNVEMCDIVLSCISPDSSNDADSLINNLIEKNLFIVPLDSEGGWYRYHHILSESLKLEFEKSSFQNIIFKKIADWCRQNDLLEEAIEYALKRKEHHQAAEFLEEYGIHFFYRQALAKLTQWQKGLNSSVLADHPLLCVVFSLLEMWKFNNKKIITFKTLATENAHKNKNFPIQLYVIFIDVYLNCFFDSSDESISKVNKIIKELENHHDAFSEMMLGMAYYSMCELGTIKGDFKKIDSHLDNVILFAKRTHNITIYHIACALKCESYFMKGKLDLAASLVGKSREIITSLQDKNEILNLEEQLHFLDLRYSDICYERGDFQQMKNRIRDYSFIAESDQVINMNFMDSCQRAKVLVAENKLEDALRLVRRIENKIDVQQNYFAMMPIWIKCLIYLIKIQIFHWMPSATYLLEDVAISISGIDANLFLDKEYFIGSYDLVRAWLNYHQGDLDTADKILSPLIKTSQANQHRMQILKYELLRSLILYRQGKTDRSMELIKKQIEFTSKQQVIQSFVEYGPEMIQLLKQCQALTPGNNHIARILSRFEVYRQKLQQSSEIVISKKEYDQLIEPLKERELIILQALDSARSNKQIADDLFLSVNTIKWYVKIIYEKLGVNKRLDAVNRARQLGVLS